MTMNPQTRLIISWGVSKGRDTYGYNICRLDDAVTGKRYRTSGGGYDMIGTVIGMWLEDAHQTALRNIANRAESYFSKAAGYQSHRTPDNRNPDPAYLYGMTRNDDTGAVTLNGVCGTRTMCDIAEAIGLNLESFHDRKGRILGYVVRLRDEKLAA